MACADIRDLRGREFSHTTERIDYLFGRDHKGESPPERLELGILDRGVVRGVAVGAEDHLVSSCVGLPCGRAATVVGHRAADDDGIDTEVPEYVVERGVGEGTVAGF